MRLHDLEKDALIVMFTKYGASGWTQHTTKVTYPIFAKMFEPYGDGVYHDIGDILAEKGYFLIDYVPLPEYDEPVVRYRPTFKGMWAGFILKKYGKHSKSHKI